MMFRFSFFPALCAVVLWAGAARAQVGAPQVSGRVLETGERSDHPLPMAPNPNVTAASRLEVGGSSAPSVPRLAAPSSAPAPQTPAPNAPASASDAPTSSQTTTCPPTLPASSARLARAAERAATRAVTLPSARTTAYARNNRIPVFFYAARNASGPAPAAILLHPLGGGIDLSQRFARYLAFRGINAAVIELPYHYSRAIGKRPVSIYVSKDPKIAAPAFDQAAADVSVVADWLQKQPEVNPDKLGIVGVSLGAIVTHLAMGRDARLNNGVAIVGGGDLLRISQLSPIAKLLLLTTGGIETTKISRDELDKADPLYNASKNQPRRVLMIQGARDEIIPPAAATELWEALGRPPIQWLDIGHVGLYLGVRSAENASYRFLLNGWNGATDAPVPRVYAPTIKSGVLLGLDSNFTFATTFQLPLVRKRNHQSLLHGDLGYSGRGPYYGLGLTVTKFLDVGVGRRFSGNRFRVYAGYGVVF